MPYKKKVPKYKFRNKKAFYSVMSLYERLKYRSDIAIIETHNDSKTAPNPARPSSADYIVDVENQVMDVVKDYKIYDQFMRTYFFDEKLLPKGKIADIIHKVGGLLVDRNIWPINGYFDTMRERIN